MAKTKKDKIKVTRPRKVKISILTLTAVSAAAITGACLISALTKDVDKNSVNDALKFKTKKLVDGIAEHLSDVIEYEFATNANYSYPIKDYTANAIVASEESMQVYGTATLNKRDYPEVYNLIEFGGENYTEFYNNQYVPFVEMINSNQATQEDADAFLQQFIAATNENNIISVREIELVKDENTLQLSKDVLSNNIAADASISETDKANMTQSLAHTNEFKIVDSHFVEQGFDMQTRKYVYNYTGIIFFNGYQFHINTNIYTSNRVTSVNELTSILLNQYATQKDTFNVKTGKVENFQQILNNYLELAEQQEQETSVEEETEME